MVKFLLSSIYAICQISVGLVLHPYQTLQSVVQEKVFIWMAALPGVMLLFFVVNWRVWLLPFLQFWFECYPSFPILCRTADVAALWVTFFCLYWQVLVAYLTFRFLLVFRNVR